MKKFLFSFLCISMLCFSQETEVIDWSSGSANPVSSFPNNIDAFGNDLFIMFMNHSLYHVDLDDANPTMNLVGSNFRDLASMVMHNNILYFSESAETDPSRATAIYSWDFQDSSATPQIYYQNATEKIVDIALIGNNLYYLEDNNQNVRTIDLTSSTPTPTTLYNYNPPTFRTFRSMASEGNNLYISVLDLEDEFNTFYAILELDITDTSSIQEIVTDLDDVRPDIFVSNNNLYYVNFLAGGLNQINLATNGTPTTISVNNFANGGLTGIDDDLLYADQDKIYRIADVLSTKEINSNATTLRISPNPASDFVNITSEIQYRNYSIISASGKLIKTGQVSDNSISLNGLNPGVYFLNLDDIVFKKFIKN